VRTNVLMSRFRLCSKNAKSILFRSVRLCMYDVVLWKYFSITSFNKFKAAYHKCIRNMFCCARCDSMSGILIELAVPFVNTIVHTCRVFFARLCSGRCQSVRLFNGLQLLVSSSSSTGFFCTVVITLVFLASFVRFAVLCFCMHFCMFYRVRSEINVDNDDNTSTLPVRD